MAGSPSREIVDAVLEAIPLEITILDEDDRVVGWNTLRPRIFGRSAGILGRDIRECHSEKSLGTLERLLREMKGGERDAARFWYDREEGGVAQKLVVDYVALRDDTGRYLGCIETLQDVEPFRALEGERKTLDG